MNTCEAASDNRHTYTQGKQHHSPGTHVYMWSSFTQQAHMCIRITHQSQCTGITHQVHMYTCTASSHTWITCKVASHTRQTWGIHVHPTPSTHVHIFCSITDQAYTYTCRAAAHHFLSPWHYFPSPPLWPHFLLPSPQRCHFLSLAAALASLRLKWLSGKPAALMTSPICPLPASLPTHGWRRPQALSLLGQGHGGITWWLRGCWGHGEVRDHLGVVGSHRGQR
jgi:hypothetical protein